MKNFINKDGFRKEKGLENTVNSILIQFAYFLREKIFEKSKDNNVTLENVKSSIEETKFSLEEISKASISTICKKEYLGRLYKKDSSKKINLDGNELFQRIVNYYGNIVIDNAKENSKTRKTLTKEMVLWAGKKIGKEKQIPFTYPKDLEEDKKPESDEIPEKYSLTLYDETEIDCDKIIQALMGNYQIILMGPPGTSKSFLAKQIAFNITKDQENIKFVQIHPEYSYEDFIEGKEPQPIGGGGIEFKSIKKKFWYYCQEAIKDDKSNFVLILDEINRGNIEKIFGELIWALEYRDESVQLLYSDDKLVIPRNLFIIGTMNTVDLSIANIDSAIRRRFFIVEIKPDENFLRNWLISSLGEEMKDLIERIILFMHDLNQEIKDSETLNEYQCIGHSYFMLKRGETIEEKISYLKIIWDYSIEPLLLEYHQFNRDEIKVYIDLWQQFYDDITELIS